MYKCQRQNNERWNCSKNVFKEKQINSKDVVLPFDIMQMGFDIVDDCDRNAIALLTA